MKHIVTVTIEAPSHHQIKSASGSLLFHFAKAYAQTNGASINIHHGDPENPEWLAGYLKHMGSFMATTSFQPEAKTMRKIAKRREVKKRSLLGEMASNLKDSIVEGLTT